MKQVNEQLISFETAKLAKEKGFLVNKQKKCYDSVGKFLYPINRLIGKPPYYSAPTQSLLQKWIRENKKIHIRVNYDSLVAKYNKDKKGKYFCGFDYNGTLYCSVGCNTYEKALEQGLLRVLGLIK